jgi:hypothetical protein
LCDADYATLDQLEYIASIAACSRDQEA